MKSATTQAPAADAFQSVSATYGAGGLADPYPLYAAARRDEPRLSAGQRVIASFALDDCVVLVLKPSEFHRKKAAFAAAGSQAMQVRPRSIKGQNDEKTQTATYIGLILE